jgi:hypothetical protein
MSSEERGRPCPHCGERFLGLVDAHDCPEYPEQLTETCPICSEPIESFLGHMADCPGPDGVPTDNR